MPRKSPRGLAHVFSTASAVIAVCFALCANRVTAAAPTFANGVTNGFVNTYDISEASGIIVSRQNPGVLWTHNDSGYPHGSIMALTTNGTYLARHYPPDIYSGNFEDISFGPGPIPQHQYIYLGDIGDNFLTRPNIRVLRFPEPAVYYHQSNSVIFAPLVGTEEITLTYPDGPWDSEAMLVDPLSGDLFLLTKQTNSSRIYRATRAEMNSGNPVALTFMREISFQKVSGADISADGLLIALRRQNKGSLWVRTASQTVSDALNGSSSTIPVIGDAGGELNGEAIGFDPTASSYYTISEGSFPPIFYFARTSTLPTPPRVFIAPGSDWHFLDTGAPPPANWRIVTNDTWSIGPAPLGYGGNERTSVAYGNSGNKYATTYFRKTFSASSSIQNLALRLCFNDGVAVYLNGTEILRRNLGGNATFTNYATAPNIDQWRTWFSYPVTNTLLRVGTNVVAVELHRADATGALLNFDLQLVEAKVEAPPRVSSVRRLGANCVVTVTGPTNLVARIERSTDSQTWTFDRQLLLSNGTATFTNPFTPPRSYFRVAP